MSYEEVKSRFSDVVPEPGPAPDQRRQRTALAVLSNPRASGNRTRLGRVRAFCAARPNVLHIELERHHTADALRQVLAARPRMIAINGGDGTAHTVLTELYREGLLARDIPPIAMLPGGKTNQIAKDAGYTGETLQALERCHAIARTQDGVGLLERQPILLTGAGIEPAVGMFIGSGGLTDSMLHCRHVFYPLGLPPGLSHALEVMATLVSMATGWTGRFLPPPPSTVTVRNGEGDHLSGPFQVIMETSLHHLVLRGTTPLPEPGKVQVVAVERRWLTAVRIVLQTLVRKLGREEIPGLHWLRGEQIRIATRCLIMDGEIIAPAEGQEVTLELLPPVKFVDLSS